MKPGQFQLGVVTETNHRPDGSIKTLTLKTPSNKHPIVRDIRKCFLLEHDFLKLTEPVHSCLLQDLEEWNNEVQSNLLERDWHESLIKFKNFLNPQNLRNVFCPSKGLTPLKKHEYHSVKIESWEQTYFHTWSSNEVTNTSVVDNWQCDKKIFFSTTYFVLVFLQILPLCTITRY